MTSERDKEQPFDSSAVAARLLSLLAETSSSAASSSYDSAASNAWSTIGLGQDSTASVGVTDEASNKRALQWETISSVPPPPSPDYILVQRDHLKDLEEDVCEMSKPRKRYSEVGWAFFSSGIALLAGAIAGGLSQTDQQGLLRNYVFWFALVGVGLLVGFICMLLLAKEEARTKTKTERRIRDRMTRINGENKQSDSEDKGE